MGRDLPHGQKRVHEKLQTTHLDTTAHSVAPSLRGVEIVGQEAPDVLEYTILRAQMVDPGEEVEHQVGLAIVRLLKHVQRRMRLADRRHQYGSDASTNQTPEIPREAGDDAVNLLWGGWKRERRFVLDVIWRWTLPLLHVSLDRITENKVGTLVVYRS